MLDGHEGRAAREKSRPVVEISGSANAESGVVDFHMADLIRTYFDMDGRHIQFNAAGRETLPTAQRDPEEHLDSIVRVAGCSDCFCNLDKPLQDEIIERTEQGF